LAPPGIFSVPDGNILIESTLSLMVTFYLRQFVVLSQQMVSTPGAEINGDIVQDQRWDESNSSIKQRFLPK